MIPYPEALGMLQSDQQTGIERWTALTQSHIRSARGRHHLVAELEISTGSSGSWLPRRHACIY